MVYSELANWDGSVRDSSVHSSPPRKLIPQSGVIIGNNESNKEGGLTALGEASMVAQSVDGTQSPHGHPAKSTSGSDAECNDMLNERGQVERHEEPGQVVLQETTRSDHATRLYELLAVFEKEKANTDSESSANEAQSTPLAAFGDGPESELEQSSSAEVNNVTNDSSEGTREDSDVQNHGTQKANEIQAVAGHVNNEALNIATQICDSTGDSDGLVPSDEGKPAVPTTEESESVDRQIAAGAPPEDMEISEEAPEINVVCAGTCDMDVDEPGAIALASAGIPIPPSPVLGVEERIGRVDSIAKDTENTQTESPIIFEPVQDTSVPSQGNFRDTSLEIHTPDTALVASVFLRIVDPNSANPPSSTSAPLDHSAFTIDSLTDVLPNGNVSPPVPNDQPAGASSNLPGPSFAPDDLIEDPVHIKPVTQVSDASNTIKDAPASGDIVDVPSSPLTEIGSVSVDGNIDLKSPTPARSNANAEHRSSNVIQGVRPAHRAGSFSDAGKSSASGMRTTTSRSSSAPPCLNLPPRLVLDCVIAPPFYLPKEMYCSMADAYADVAARPVFESEINENDDEDEGESDITGRINNRTKAIEGGGGDMAEPSPSFWDSSPLSTPPAVEQQDDPFADMDVDNSPDGGCRDISLGPGAGSSSAPLKRKRAFSISPSTQRDHRTSSPSCARTGPEALALFGSSLSLYSLRGAEGGTFIGRGTVQCDPADGGRVSVKVSVDAGAQFFIGGGTYEAGAPKIARKGPGRPKKAGPSGSGSRFSKPQTAKRKVIIKEEMFEDSNEDLNVRDPTNATCHSCRYRSENPKMSCSGFRKNGLPCGLRFCSRCIERRFPDVHFDAYNRSYTCPKCLRTCSCAECRRRWLSEMENHGPDIQSVSSKNTADAVNVRAEGLSPLAQPFSTRQPAETADDDLGEGPSSLMRTAPSSLMRKASTKAIYAMKSTVVEAFSGEEMSASEEIQDDDGSDYIVVDNSKARAYAGPSNTTLKKTMARSKTSGSKRKNKNLPELVPNKTCHQCRKCEDSYEKMICNNVPKGRRPCRGTYCRRCIVKRYPDIVFKSLGRFRCPKCYGKCNCDQCAKARGERYIREKEFQEMLEAKGIVPEGLAAEIPPLSPKKARRKLKAACEHNVELVNIGEEAEEWVQLRREEICAQGEDHYPKRLRAFVGDWHSMWGTTRTCLAMDSADAPVGQAGSSNSATHLSDVPTSGGTRRRLYIGDTAGLHRTFVSVDSVHLSEDELILNDEDPQGAIEVDIVRSRSGRLITPSAKMRQYDDNEDDVSLSAPTRKKRRKLSAGAAHDSSLPSVRPASKTPVTPLFTAFSATERSPLSMFGSPLTDRDASGESEPDIIESFSVDLPKIGEDTTKEASLPPGTLDLLPLEPMEAESAVDVGSSFGESLSSGPTQDALTNFDVPDHLKTEAADKTGPGGPFEEYVTENELGIDGHAETTAENVALAVQAI